MKGWLSRLFKGRQLGEVQGLEQPIAAKLQEEQPKLNIQAIELQPLLQATLDKFKPYAAQRQVSLCVMQPTASLWVLADSLRLQQIVVNLLVNAVNFSPAGTKVELWVTRTAERVKLMVTDQGEGIPLAFQSKVFERFSQAESNLHQVLKGGGVGLAITRELTTAMNGQIGFSSLPGRGSCFFIELPRCID